MTKKRMLLVILVMLLIWCSYYAFFYPMGSGKKNNSGQGEPMQNVAEKTENENSKNGETAQGEENSGAGAEEQQPPEKEEEEKEKEKEKPIPLGDDAVTILVNKENPVGKDFVPEELELPINRVSNRMESSQRLVHSAAVAFNSLTEAAKDAGYEIFITTAYRDYNFQNTLYTNYVARDGQAAADRYSARPGYSEHQTGLAADVSAVSVNYDLTREFGNTEEGKWLAENCSKFGFIIRYQEGKEEITGYKYEPWHIRYVGREVAQYVTDNGLTFEEYWELRKAQEEQEGSGSAEGTENTTTQEN